MSAISNSNNFNYEYQAPKSNPSSNRIKPGLFKLMMEPLRKSIGKSIGNKLSYINLSKAEKANLKTNKDNFVNDIENHAEAISISMQNQKGNISHQLNGISINPGEEDTGKYILVFFGMGDCYEKHLDSLKKLSQDTGTTVVSFNYRGINESTGKANSAEDYITDGSAFMDYLMKEKGADSKDILRYGHSLGGGVAAQVGIDSPIISESSFSTFKEAVKGKEGKVNAWLIKKAGWNMNSVKALETIEDKKLGIVVNRRDPTINYEKASLYKKMNKDDLNYIKIGSKKDPNDSINRIKKEGWIKHVRHPHQLVMDQSHDEATIDIPHEIQEELNKLDKDSQEYKDKLEVANELVALNKHYASEDNAAYEGILNMINEMLELKSE